MSNPAVAPSEPYVLNADAPPDAYWAFLSEEAWMDTVKAAKQLPTVVAAIEGLDLELRPSFHIPKNLCVDPQASQGHKPFLASAKKLPLSVKLSSGYAYNVLLPLWRALDSEQERAAIAVTLADTVSCDGGAEFAIGRLIAHAPRMRKAFRLSPPTAAETSLALKHNGVNLLALPPRAYRAYPLEPREGDTPIRSNPKASTGFPVLGKSDDPRAAAKVSQLAITTRKEIVEASRAPGGVARWLRTAEDERPYLVTMQGKAKLDCYTSSKAEQKQMRFYNTVPKHLLLNMQVAMQPLEACKRNCFNDEDTRSVSGISLANGGAAQLIACAEAALADRNCAYFTCGDDTFFAYRGSDGRIHLFAIDGTSFDITLDGDVTAPIHSSLRDQLALIDMPSGDLWFALMRKRQIALALTCVVRTRHMGVSGMPGQSIVNGCVMDVSCQRLEVALARMEATKPLNEDSINRTIELIGRSLGLKLRVEQYSVSEPGVTLTEHLATNYYKFIGYIFYSRDGVVYVYCDLPRQCAQMRYPVRYIKQKRDFQISEAIRLGSVVSNWGVFPPHLRPAQDAAVAAVIDLVEDVISKFGKVEGEDLRWSALESPYGLATVPSLMGTLHLLQRDPLDFWGPPGSSPAPPTPSTPPATTAEKSWAEQQDEEEEREREECRALGIPSPPRSKRPAPLPISLPSKPAATHPATLANLGRNPPTVVWQPDKPKRIAAFQGDRRLVRVSRVLADDEEDQYYERAVREGLVSDDDNASYADDQDSNLVDQQFAEDWYNRGWHGTADGQPDN